MAWIKACSVGDFEPDEGIRVEADPPVAVFHVDGEYFAIGDICTHGQSSLAEGYLDGTEVECSWHFAKFCLRTGRALTLPATEDVATYPVRVEDDIVFVDV
ncbi:MULTISPECIES: bifunctional 3-phenylpropionate/cinnamic acid dioxygenase ferredoxin subunit [unclassified Mycobacterium]|uniref:bifunctional 3-phenylpropionate/cinnamic acid dioxygenase ferredoxin subunit n=1 Tax=unclassified Mycobacterium TaxID=2642494 RepID=UPI0029C6E571|nr:MULTISPECIES: bifunctional 3-phenylpropionate/cinnamic acid dioxygenase ferredoxin subunit [unclassified Mycobacterium]